MIQTKIISKGFTLIELLVVLAIVAILSVVVILTLNPAELLKQARDSNRISDLGTLKSAISLYLADVSSPAIGTSTNCYVSVPSANFVMSIANCGFAGSYTITSSSVANNRKVDNSGWVPINFNSISSGAPIGNLPVDPTNNATLFYAYVSTSTNNGFKMQTFLESNKYNSLMANDGGVSSTVYEVGTNLTL